MAEVLLCLLVAWVIVTALSKGGPKGRPFSGIFWPTKRRRRK